MNLFIIFANYYQVLILLALAAVVAADSYGKSGYGGGYGGYKTDYAVSLLTFISYQPILFLIGTFLFL